ncbi:MAG: hypothetical protein M0Q91_05530 [Methanoregula sp.]|jgi:hypothetical protein|nr:hypothetical protein [Methanoregula sp.]
MIITRKAIAGFILLGIIVFATTQFTVNQMRQPPKASQDISTKPTAPELAFPNLDPSIKIQYQPPIVSLGNNAPVVVTAIIEFFTFGCYLVLKKYEPVINKAAENFVGGLKQ